MCFDTVPLKSGLFGNLNQLFLKRHCESMLKNFSVSFPPEYYLYCSKTVTFLRVVVYSDPSADHGNKYNCATFSQNFVFEIYRIIALFYRIRCFSSIEMPCHVYGFSLSEVLLFSLELSPRTLSEKVMMLPFLFSSFLSPSFSIPLF